MGRRLMEERAGTQKKKGHPGGEKVRAAVSCALQNGKASNGTGEQEKVPKEKQGDRRCQTCVESSE